MKVTHDDVIVLRPGKFVEFVDVQVPCNEAADGIPPEPSGRGPTNGKFKAAKHKKKAKPMRAKMRKR